MNTRILLSVIILSLSSTFAFASMDESSISVVASENANVFKVIYKSAVMNRVHVSIRNSRNEIVFSESFKKMNKFTRPYNFKGLPEGEYTIEVKDNHGKKVEKVNYSLGVVKSLVKVTKINGDRAKFMVSVGNKGMNIIDVSIYNADGDLLIYNAHVVEGDFGIVYNLVTAGAYTFVVSDKTGKSTTIQF